MKTHKDINCSFLPKRDVQHLKNESSALTKWLMARNYNKLLPFLADGTKQLTRSCNDKRRTRGWQTGSCFLSMFKKCKDYIQRDLNTVCPYCSGDVIDRDGIFAWTSCWPWFHLLSALWEGSASSCCLLWCVWRQWICAMWQDPRTTLLLLSECISKALSHFGGCD